MLTTEDFIEEMLRKVPELRPYYQEHLVDYDELLPHVFMGDVTRYVMNLARRIIEEGNSQSKEQLSTLLDLFEVVFDRGEPYVQELIANSFLENLDRDDLSYALLKQRLGNGLSLQLKKIEQTYQ
jgi:hypothetical protein